MLDQNKISLVYLALDRLELIRYNIVEKARKRKRYFFISCFFILVNSFVFEAGGFWLYHIIWGGVFVYFLYYAVYYYNYKSKLQEIDKAVNLFYGIKYENNTVIQHHIKLFYDLLELSDKPFTVFQIKVKSNENQIKQK